MKKNILKNPNRKESKVNNESYEDLYIQLGVYDDSEIMNCHFLRVDFEGVWLNGAQFKKCRFHSVLFYGIQGFDAEFHDSDFSNVRFRGCNLEKTDFSNSVLGEVVFETDNINHKTDISGADFSNVDLSNVTFNKVLYDGSTKFPESFNPARHPGLERK